MKEFEALRLLNEYMDEYVPKSPESDEVFATVLQSVVKRAGMKPNLESREHLAFVEFEDETSTIEKGKFIAWCCPCCSAEVGERYQIGEGFHDQRRKKFCSECGQKILWE